MTETELQELVKVIADEVHQHVSAIVTPLEREIVALKSRPLQKWAGVHVAGVAYAEASLVTKSGSLWVSERQTDTTPGDPGSDWRLIVKRGTV